MAQREERIGRFTIFYYSSYMDPTELLEGLAKGERTEGRGRGGISVFEAGGLKLVARKYMHGGLFRGLTRDLYLGQGRATSEGSVMAYLLERGCPVVAPFCAIVEQLFVAKRLYLVTYLEEGALELIEHLGRSTRRERLRCARRLAGLLWLLKQAGVYHPDFHLKNVLVTPEKKLLFLDFDRARRRAVNDRAMKSMFLRMARYADKMERQGKLHTSDEEKLMFLRTYARLSGTDLTEGMISSARRAAILARIGWFLEALVYDR